MLLVRIRAVMRQKNNLAKKVMFCCNSNFVFFFLSVVISWVGYGCSLEEKSLQLLIFEQVELLEHAILFHGHEVVESDAVGQARVVHLLETEELGDIGSGAGVAGCINSVSDTEGPHGIDLGGIHIEWVPARWQGGGRSNDVTEGDIRVGELSTEQAIHVRVVAGDRKVSPKHLNGVVGAGIDSLKGLLRCEDNIDDNIGVGITQCLALIDNREDIEIPNG